MSEKIRHDDVPEPIAVIMRNRAQLAELVGPERATSTPAAGHHYSNLLHLWDRAAACIIEAHFGYTRMAVEESFSILGAQKRDGMQRNMQPAAGVGRLYDPEVLTFMHPDKGSDYTQPPIFATAVDATYNAIKHDDKEQAKLYLQSIYPGVRKSLGYFEKHRQISPTNPLIFNIHPHETGRDSDETLNQRTKHKLPRQGKETPLAVDVVNAGLDYLGVIALSARNRIHGWDPDKIRKYYRPVDPMFNALYAANLRVAARHAAELDKHEDANHMRHLAKEVSERIQTDMWFPEARHGEGAILALSKEGPVDENNVSIGSLGVLVLEDLKEPILESVLTMIERSFNTKFPLPSIATDSPFYDPKGQQLHRLWIGETWIITNWIIAEGLKMQAGRADLAHRPDLVERCLYLADRIILSSKELVKQGYFEKYNPETGEPQRTKTVYNFVWDGLAETM